MDPVLLHGVGTGIVTGAVVSFGIRKAPRPYVKKQCCRHILYYATHWFYAAFFSNVLLLLVFGEGFEVESQAMLGYALMMIAFTWPANLWLVKRATRSWVRDEPRVEDESLSHIRQFTRLEGETLL